MQCEVKALSYPAAALFAFCVAVVAYDMPGVPKAALRGAHGAEKVDEEVSGYYIAGEPKRVYEGMTIAIPDGHCKASGAMPTTRFAAFLRGAAARVSLPKYEKHPRGPKKPAVERRHRRDHPHVARAELLAARKTKKKMGKVANFLHVGRHGLLESGMLSELNHARMYLRYV